MTYSVLGIDQSMCSTGIAHFRAGASRPHWEIWRCDPWQIGDKEGFHLAEFDAKLRAICKERKVTHMFGENHDFVQHLHHETLTQRLATYGLMGKILEVGAILGIETALVAVNDWHGVCLGTKSAPEGYTKAARRKFWKDLSRTVAQRQWNISADELSDDTADALHIGAYGASTIDPRFLVANAPFWRRQEDRIAEGRRG